MIYLQYKLRRAGIERPSNILVLCELPEKEVGDIVEEMTAIAPEATITVGFPEDESTKFDLVVIAYWHRLGTRRIIRNYRKFGRIRKGTVMLYERTARRAVLFDSQQVARRALSSLIESFLAKMLIVLGRKTLKSS